MEEEIFIKGDFWLPDTPNHIVRGETTYVPGEGITLEVEGDLSERAIGKFGFAEFINHPIILGISTSGEEVTLRNCQQKGVRFGNNLITTFHSNMLFIGCHFNSDDQIKFQGLSVEFANLFYWMAKKIYSIENVDNSIRISSNELDPIKVTIGNYQLEFTTGYSYSVEKDNIELTHNTKVKTWSDIAIPIDNHFRLVRHIQNFLSLAMLKPTLPIKVDAFTSLKIRKLETERVYHIPIQVFYPVAEKISKPSKVYASDMLFTLPMVENQLADLLDNWIDKSEYLKPVYDLYFSTLYNPNIYIDFKFLTVVQAIETYHRRAYGGKYQEDDEYHEGLYKALINAIPANVESDFISSLKKGKLLYANEYSLRKRLLLLAKHVNEIVPLSFIKSNSQQSEFAERVSDTRNYLTHYTPNLKSKAASTGAEFYELTEKLRVILEICFLEELGFTPERIMELVQTRPRYNAYIII